MNDWVIGYVPVLHQGYLQFFEAHAGSNLGLIGPDFYRSDEGGLHPFERLNREIRAVDSEVMSRAIRALGIFSFVNALSRHDIVARVGDKPVVMPDEDVSRFVAETYLSDHQVRFESWFLRFDLPASLSKIPPNADRTVVTDADLVIMRRAHEEARKSPDWWRQIGAAAVKDGIVLYLAHNLHMPSQHSLYAMGDPRNNFLAGEQIEVSCAHHAERSIISRAAGDGTALAGASLYVTTFPCPQCAYSIIGARFSRVYYRDGYSLLGADAALKAHGVEIIHVSGAFGQ